MNKNYYIALTGAKKNVGDFLITKRSLELLNLIGSDYEFIVRPYWETLNDLDFINSSKGIIILGGPGFGRDMYPGIYKLRDNIDEISVHVYTLGCGWNAFPGTKQTIERYKYSDTAKLLLEKMEKTEAGMSCRDYQTETTLHKNGFSNVVMTGCPVWYHLDSLGKEFKKPNKIEKIVYTPAQKYRFSDQSEEVMLYLKQRYSNAEIIVAFHRGIYEVDEFTSQEEVDNTIKLANFAKKLGLEVRDLSYNASKMDFYDECDLHVGYRVHAHIYFLSKRLPSILLNEDCRGIGANETLGSRGVNAFKIYNNDLVENNKEITYELEETLLNIESNNYDDFEKITKLIDKHFIVMKNYIESILAENEEK